MNYTENYQLPQWEENDRILMADFNEAMGNIEAGLTAKGDCRIVAGSYVGTGKYGPSNRNTLTFGFAPQVIFLGTNLVDNYNSVPEYYILFRGVNHFVARNTSSKNTVEWSGNTVTWYFGSTNDSEGEIKQLNESGKTYQYLAIG